MRSRLSCLQKAEFFSISYSSSVQILRHLASKSAVLSNALIILLHGYSSHSPQLLNPRDFVHSTILYVQTFSGLHPKHLISSFETIRSLHPILYHNNAVSESSFPVLGINLGHNVQLSPQAEIINSVTSSIKQKTPLRINNIQRDDNIVVPPYFVQKYLNSCSLTVALRCACFAHPQRWYSIANQ